MLSLDSDDFKTSPGKIRDDALIEFTLSTRHEPTVSIYKRSQLRNIAKGSDLLTSIADVPENAEEASSHIAIRRDFREYQANSFSYIMDVLLYNRAGPLNSDIDRKDLNRLAAYMGLKAEVGKLIYTDVDLMYPMCLSQWDRDIRNHEKSLRKVLYANEEVDYRSQDSMFHFEKICSKMDFPIDEKNEQADANFENEHPLFVPIQGGNESIYDDGLKTYHRGAFGDAKRCPECVTQQLKAENHHNNGTSLQPKYGYLKCNVHIDRKRGGDADPDYDIAVRSLGDFEYPCIGIPRKFSHVKERYSQFETLFHRTTLYMFHDFDWTDLCVAGGSVYNILTGLGDNDGKLSGNSTKLNDLDFNLITKDPKRAEKACERVLQTVKEYCDRNLENADRVMIARTQGSLTISFLRPPPNHYPNVVGSSEGNIGDGDYCFKVQIILRLYNSIAQVVSGFDIDASTAAWDGKHLYAMPRFVRVLKYGVNIVDPERQSANYHQRLYKYLNRGVAMAIPDYVPKRALLNFGEHPKGLARVLAFWYEKKRLNRTKLFYTGENQVLAELGDYGEDFRSTMRRRLRAYVAREALKTYKRRVYNKEELMLEGNNLVMKMFEVTQKPSEYLLSVNQKLPVRFYYNVDELFGNAHVDESNMVQIEVNAAIDRVRPSEEVIETFPPFQNLFLPGPAQNKLVFDERSFELSRQGDFLFESSLPKAIEFKTHNVGDQTTNSFNPTFDDWYCDLYVLPSI